jgi:hypothetical protein
MTYNELYSKATTWTARHIAQDLLLMYGGKEVASQFDIDKVNCWQIREEGTPILPLTDYLVVVSPGEGWQTIWLVMDAPSGTEAEQMVWTERRYNSGEPIRVRPVADRTGASASATYVTTYDIKRVEESRELVRYK